MRLMEMQALRGDALLESFSVGMTEEQRSMAKRTHDAWRTIVMEASIDAAKIDQLFGYIEQNSTDNKTGVGKAIDGAKIAGKWAIDAAKWAQDTAPVKGFDKLVQEGIAAIGDRLPPKVVDQIKKMSEWAKKPENSGKQALMIGTITALVSILATPMAGAVAAGMLRTTLGMMKGERPSTAIAKASAMFVGSWLIGLGTKEICAYLADGTAKIITNFAGIQDVAQIRMWWTHTGLPSMLIEGYIPAEDYRRVQALFSRAQDLMKQGNVEEGLRVYGRLSAWIYDPDRLNAIYATMENNRTLREKVRIASQTGRQVFNAISAALQGAATSKMSKAVGEHRALRDDQISHILNEAIFSNIKKMAANWGNNLTAKVTADKLMRAWKAGNEPTDLGDLTEVLRKAGVKDDIIAAAYKDAGVDQADIDSVIKPEASATQPTINNDPVPFTIGYEPFDNEAAEAWKTGGKDAFVKYWQDKTPEVERLVADTKKKKDAEPSSKPRGASPPGTIVSTPKGRYQKIDDKRWKDLSTGKVVFPAVAKDRGLSENASSGGTSSGSVASVASPIGGVVRRASDVSFFGGPVNWSKPKKKRPKRG